MLEIHEKKNTDGYENIIQNIDCQYLHIVESINGDSVNAVSYTHLTLPTTSRV